MLQLLILKRVYTALFQPNVMSGSAMPHLFSVLFFVFFFCLSDSKHIDIIDGTDLSKRLRKKGFGY